MSQRLQSLDVFRGLTIATMILVNNPGPSFSVYAPLLHAHWHGWTPTDMVFPFFLWISGVAMTLSFARRRTEGSDKTRLLLHTARRAGLIFLIGFLFNLVPKFDFAHVRIPGVLQRIAVCYFFATLIYLYTSRRGQILAILALFGVYTATMLYLPYPGAGSDPWSIDSNAARYIDGLLLKDHMWATSKVWDPEGILSTLPAIATVLCGILAANYLVSGALLTIAGLLLGTVLPINKSLWTPSFVLLMAGLASLIFGALHWWIDEKGNRRGWSFFQIYGGNAIVSFVLSGVLGRILALTSIDGMPSSKWILTNVFLPIASPANASLLYAISNVLVIFSVVYWLYRKKIHIRL
ncbi:acyltransferase family protein [Bryobacter aggregatus]|uniref:acyltransferase family protein n=1 Tax=Bryobacter aggregatus TaxID=360054 RepID=UPI0004E22F61|nr:heparan-alpha-glucosaminide N-acetyltransferase domain-containing protein [Bryobacter aggregatus]